MDTIRFSVIVPTCNRLPSLQKTLECLFRQHHSPVEIIVVDDGSVDATPRYLQELASAGKLRYLRQENQGPASARNAGINVATGHIIGFTDDDCTLPPDWASAYIRAFQSRDVALIGGTARNAVTGNYFSELSQDITNYYVRALVRTDGSTLFLTSNNIAVRAPMLKAAGGFDARFRRAGGEERALFYRLLSAGGRCVLDEDIVVDHHHELSFMKFLRQQRNYGRGAYILHGISRPGQEIRPAPIPLRVYAGLVRTFFAKGFVAGCTRTLCFVAGQFSASAGYLLEALTPRQSPPHR